MAHKRRKKTGIERRDERRGREWQVETDNIREKNVAIKRQRTGLPLNITPATS